MTSAFSTEDFSVDQFSAAGASFQHTLASPICCAGVGLHSGRPARLTLHPAAPNAGITFHRIDLPGARPLPARFDQVTDTRLSTVIGDPPHRIGTIEHVMAALAGTGIDNAHIEIDGPELPILDGSASDFLFLIDCAGRAAQSAPRRAIDILRPVRVTAGEAWAELRPHADPSATGLHMSLSIDFAAAAIGRQSYALALTEHSFRHDLAQARTFTQAAEIAQLRAAGLALGGSLDNAVVVDGAEILNPGGLRMEAEFVRHKLLDAVGDLALAGHALRGQFTAHRTGHVLNNQLLHALFAQHANHRLTTAHPSAWLAAA